MVRKTIRRKTVGRKPKVQRKRRTMRGGNNRMSPALVKAITRRSEELKKTPTLQIFKKNGTGSNLTSPNGKITIASATLNEPVTIKENYFPSGNSEKSRSLRRF